MEEVKRLGGVDLVVEMLANINLGIYACTVEGSYEKLTSICIDRDMEMLAQGGRIAVVGNRGTVRFLSRRKSHISQSTNGGSRLKSILAS